MNEKEALKINSRTTDSNFLQAKADGYLAALTGEEMKAKDERLLSKQKAINALHAELAAEKARSRKLIRALEQIAGFDCQQAPWKGKPCGLCVNCIARNALNHKEASKT